MNRLSGRGKSEENKGQERVKRRGGGWGRKEGEREESSSPVYARLARLADLFSRFFPNGEPVHSYPLQFPQVIKMLQVRCFNSVTKLC